MAKSNQFENDLLKHIFQNAALTLIGDAAGLLPSAAAGSLYVSLHTADPGEAGDQTTSEATYTGYARIAVARSAGGWTVTNNLVENTAAVTYAQCTGGANTVTHFGIGTASSGAGKLLYKGSLGASAQGPFTAKVDDTITIPGHTLIVDNLAAFYAAYGSSLPTGITEGVQYFVKTVTGDDITISTTQGGATLNITAVGDGVVYKAASLAVSNGITPEFPPGAIDLLEN